MSSNEIISQAILARMATQNYQVKQLAKDLGTTREATGRRLNQHTIWDSNELDIVGKALGLTDMFGLCDYARALAEMNKCVCSIESGPCERVDVFHVSGRFWSTSACGEKRTPARPAWTSFPS